MIKFFTMLNSKSFKTKKEIFCLRWISLFILMALLLNLIVYFEPLDKNSYNDLTISNDLMLANQSDSSFVEKTSNRLRIYYLKPITIDNIEIIFKNSFFYISFIHFSIKPILSFLADFFVRAP